MGIMPWTGFAMGQRPARPGAMGQRRADAYLNKHPFAYNLPVSAKQG
ncbi:MAG: hypothetical protein M1415_03925 [Firmicutes bacterium]|nr:hypothetical protein [Bacillota bacterium]MCL5064426.1 hypothetical protein [Bacillota bacterium]